MTNRSLSLTDELYQYVLENGVQETDLLTELRHLTAHDAMARMQIAPEQGQFIAFLLSLTKPQRILEIGTFTGYSSLIMALNTPDDTKIITCDMSKQWTDTAQTFWKRAGVAHKIELKLGEALNTIRTLNHDEGFDFIFLDADKEHYPQYYLALKPLLKSGGMMMIDNVLWSGRVADKGNTEETTLGIRKLNEMVLQDQDIKSSMLPLADGVTLIHKS